MSAYSSEHLKTDAPEVWKFFFERHPETTKVSLPELIIGRIACRLAIYLGNQRFSFRAQLQAMRRDELSAVITRLMYKCLWSGWNLQGEGKEIPLPSPAPNPQLSDEPWMFVKENPDHHLIGFFTIRIVAKKQDISHIYGGSILTTYFSLVTWRR